MAEFKNWEDVLKSVQADDPNIEVYYFIRVGDSGTRFMNREECIRFIRNEMKAVYK